MLSPAEIFPPLPPEQVALFFIQLSDDLDPALFRTVYRWLNEAERAQVAGYRTTAAQRQALQAKAALRAVLSHYGKRAPTQWQFERGSHGKPALTLCQRQQTGLHFNLSHSGAWLLIAIMQVQDAAQSIEQTVQLGVDIEKGRLDIDIAPIIRHYFTEQECATLFTLSDVNAQRQRFFDLWVLKESFIKAKGLGLALPLTQFAFDLEECQSASLPLEPAFLNSMQLSEASILTFYPSVPLQQLTPLDALTWQVSLGRVDAQYRFALSVGRHDTSPTALTATRFDFASLCLAVSHHWAKKAN